MKIILAIIVYDRHDNIRRWVDCWNQCNQIAELFVIHNVNASNNVKGECKGVRYVPRNNKGIDIGAFEDVCKGRLNGFPNDWDLLLWCTDDALPMQKDFITPYLDKMTDGVGVVCTELSEYVKRHIRTIGFMISKECASKLTFPVLNTKADTYDFEHRSQNAFYEQVLNMGLKVEVVSEMKDTPLWDSGYTRGFDRAEEHLKVFGMKSKVTVICTIYQSYPQIISSMLMQTYQDWELLLIHDGPNTTGLSDLIPDDPRIKYIETKTRLQKWGHPLRQWALKNLFDLSPDSGYVVVTNADNYFVPVYLEYMVNGMVRNLKSVGVYCSDMVHSYKAWQVIPCSLQLGYLDCAGVMIRSDVAHEIGWRDTETHSSDWTYFEDIIKKYGANRFTKVKGCLLIHN